MSMHDTFILTLNNNVHNIMHQLIYIELLFDFDLIII